MSVVKGRKTDPKDAFADVFPTWKDQPVIEVAPSAYFRWKGILDRALAAILLVIGLPIIFLLTLLVRLGSCGPGIYRQTRVGKDGQTFKMYKIRTMTHDAETRTGPVWTHRNDARITPLGRLLRTLHVDELPQLFNVLRGEMSLIGPRPERPEFVHVLAKEIPGYLDRLAVLPGITGLAQINLEPDTDLDSVRRKLVLDLEYIRHAGIVLDLRMLLCTFIRLLGFSGERAMHVMKLHREVPSSGSYVPSTDVSPGFSAIPVSILGKASTNGEAASKGRARSHRKPEATTNTKPR